jgi:ABC-2 type transport system ATP-binding protein
MNELIIKDLCKHYGELEALKNINLEIKPGMFGLLGPNGAGKTTLMRTITTLLAIEQGNISFGDLSWENANAVRELIGYLPQKFSLYKHIKVEEALNHIAVLKGVKTNKNKQVQEVLERFNLLEQRNKKISQLSGGMLRRVGIAQAILGNPKIIVIDEPTAGLDPEERIRFRNSLRAIDKEAIVIISTHIVEDIEATCDQVGVLNKGTLLYSGDISNMRNKAKGKVYEITGSRDELFGLERETTVVSNKTVDDGVKVRFISEKPYKDAIEVEPSLEDGYLYLVGNANER